ncbi:Paralytic/GBP/PSP peptide [Prochlorococcus sp. MIT 1227]|uniref:Paralytic/GBP/PSP peptide n=2 Tax=Prochlorococcaceae TaxID=2881426 RepID=UPI0039A73073
MLLVFIVITMGIIPGGNVITRQVTESRLDARGVANDQLKNNQLAINPKATNLAATNPLAIQRVPANSVTSQRVPNDQVSTDETAVEQQGSKCAPGWVETGDGILCVPGLFKMLDVADTGGPGEKNCWAGGMVLNCRD